MCLASALYKNGSSWQRRGIQWHLVNVKLLNIPAREETNLVEAVVRTWRQCESVALHRIQRQVANSWRVCITPEHNSWGNWNMHKNNVQHLGLIVRQTCYLTKQIKTVVEVDPQIGVSGPRIEIDAVMLHESGSMPAESQTAYTSPSTWCSICCYDWYNICDYNWKERTLLSIKLTNVIIIFR